MGREQPEPTAQRCINESDPIISAQFTDGVIFLRPLHMGDAADHLAGEDEAIARWLSGGRSTIETVQTYINSCEEQWRNNGPRKAFGIFDVASGKLIGCIEANLDPPVSPGQANVSFGIFSAWRGKGIVGRAINLMSEYVRGANQIRQMVARISLLNTASLKAVQRAGFRLVRVVGEPEGEMAHFVRDL
ncbi:MAG: GNAT family N-acetyltransferase [Acidobacteriaceae bacterium]|nr:GNAT family N-acetyltransferase [Acidobacteriaceae bacterium]MBV9778662.1 GNAT family N-acetyltransferase [Acidobacteriaceae bacterium]